MINKLLRSSSHDNGFNSSDGLFDDLRSDGAQDRQESDNAQHENEDTEGNNHPSDGGSHNPGFGVGEINLIKSNSLFFNIKDGIVVGQEHSSENEGIDLIGLEEIPLGGQR